MGIGRASATMGSCPVIPQQVSQLYDTAVLCIYAEEMKAGTAVAICV